MCDAWKQNPAAGSHELRGQREGDQCTIDGQAGRLRKVNDKFECIPIKRQDAVMDAAAAQRVKDEAWLEMCRDLETAWKKPLP